jgi:iron complex outermembrane recepter protein
MKRVTFAFLALAATLFAAGVYAQTTGTIEGRITDETKAPLPGVTVEAISPNLSEPKLATSDTQGQFRLTMLPAGRYTIRFTLSGFNTQEQADINVAAGLMVNLRVQMRSSFKEVVTVTGSLIPRPTLEAMSPVTTLDVEQLSYHGVQRLEDIMQTLPQVFVAQNSSVSNTATGTATVALRNLGSQRTLVLIDGERMQPGDVYSVAGDLNFIPASLIKRVDVLTGGASSVYGADAVAGVVNFILDTDFEGFRGGVSGGGYEHNNDNTFWQQKNAALGYTAPSGTTWDGGNFDANIAWGGKFADGKGHASMYIDYRKTAELLKGARDYYNCTANAGSHGPACGGSGTSATGQFDVYDSAFSNELGDYTLGPNGTLVPFTSLAKFNYGAYNSIQRPDLRWSAGGFLNYDWNDHFKGYISVMLMNDETDAQIAPSGDFFGDTVQLNCNNPMLTAQEVSLLCPASGGYTSSSIANVIIGRRAVEFGPRIDQLNHNALRLLAGLKGAINKEWSYDVHAMDAQTRVSENYLNDLNINHIQDALLVTGNPSDPSSWQCMSGNAGCVPWNIFGTGSPTAAKPYLALTLLSQQRLETQLITGKINGDLKGYGLAFPTATEGIQVAIGAEYRKEFLNYLPDQAYQDGIGAGQGGSRQPVSGFYDVKEGFAEVQVPIVQGARGARDLSLNLGYRYSDYNVNGGHPTYKAEADWAPTADFKFRAGYNRATRAPNVVDLYSPQSVALSTTSTSDPCAGPSPQYSLQQCEYTGVTAAQYGKIAANPAQQYYSLQGGNPNLEPEIADTKTLGLVLTPEGTGLTATFDWYDIKITNAISSLSGDNILNYCAQTGDPRICSLIHRDFLGSLWITLQGYTITTNQNIAEYRVKGIDANFTYGVPVGNGLLNMNLIGSYLNSSFTNTGLYSYDCAGYYGDTCGIPTPKWRHLFRASYESGPWVVNLGWRYIGSVKIDEASSNPVLSAPGDIASTKVNGTYQIPAFNYIDLAVSYKLKAGVRFMLGCNNIADKQPPVLPGNANEGLAAGQFGTYDPAGRYVFSNIEFSF